MFYGFKDPDKVDQCFNRLLELREQLYAAKDTAASLSSDMLSDFDPAGSMQQTIRGINMLEDSLSRQAAEIDYMCKQFEMMLKALTTAEVYAGPERF